MATIKDIASAAGVSAAGAGSAVLLPAHPQRGAAPPGIQRPDPGHHRPGLAGHPPV